MSFLREMQGCFFSHLETHKRYAFLFYDRANEIAARPGILFCIHMLTGCATDSGCLKFFFLRQRRNRVHRTLEERADAQMTVVSHMS